MKKGLCFLLLFGLLLCSFSCGREEETVVVKSSRIYYIDKEVTQVVSEGYEPEGKTTEEQVAEYIAALETKPETEGYLQAKPESVVIKEYVVGRNGQVTLYFDSAYNEVNGTREVLMRAAIVKTLCQAEGIDSVEFYINGQPLLDVSGKPVGLMSDEDFIDNTGAQTNYYQYVYAALYFANEAGNALVESNLKIPYDGTATAEEVILRQLLAGPVEEGMKRTTSENTKLLKVSTKEGLCTVDLSEAFLEAFEGVTEEVALYSFVNSLVELPSVYKVQFTVNGETKKVFWEKLDLAGSYERNLELIEGEK